MRNALIIGGLGLNAIALVLFSKTGIATEPQQSQRYYMVGFGHAGGLTSVVVPFTSEAQCEAAGAPMRAAEGSKRNLDTYNFRFRYVCVKGAK